MESPSLQPSQQIANQQQRIADIILKTAAIADDEGETDKDVQAEANKVIRIANFMTEANTRRLEQIQKQKEKDSGHEVGGMSTPLSAE